MEKTVKNETVQNASTEGKNVRVESKDDGQITRIYSVPESKAETEVDDKDFEKMFPIVEFNKISVEDVFMKHEPETGNQKRVKAAIIEAKEINLENFRAPAVDPSFSQDGRNIVYEKGKMPAVGEDAKWWKETFKNFMPEKNSMMGPQMYRDVFLGTIIKDLVEEESYEVSAAWEAVCDRSEGLGHYYDSKDAKRVLEVTGSRKVGKWYDLGNTCKITENDTGKSGFLFGGGNYMCYGSSYPLADVNKSFDAFRRNSRCVGWMVMSV